MLSGPLPPSSGPCPDRRRISGAVRTTSAPAGRPGRHRTLRGAALAASAAVLLTGCGSSAVQVDAAEDAANPDCAPAMLAMPEQLAEQDQRETSSQGTTAYGDPSAAVVRCGVAPPQPTTDLCTRVDGVDWLIRDLGADDQWQATTYGREPAFEVTFDTKAVPSSTALVDIGSAVSSVPQTAECLSVEEAPQA